MLISKFETDDAALLKQSSKMPISKQIILLFFVCFLIGVPGAERREVHGCRCRGHDPKRSPIPSMNYEGHCDFHLSPSFTRDSNRPWCRTLENCGEQHHAGSWTYCDLRGVERRRFPDGKLYTSKEVQKHYDKGPAGQDAAQKREDAAPHIEKRMGRDQIAYTVHEFRDYYDGHLDEKGWLENWQAAGPELRRAPDGKWYSFEEFVDYYGLKEAWKMWDGGAKEAAPGRSAGSSRETRPLTTKEKIELDMQLVRIKAERDMARAHREAAEMLDQYTRVKEMSRKVEVLNWKIDELERQKARGRTEL